MPKLTVIGLSIMPYYVFKITAQKGMTMVKNLELLKEFEKYQEAKAYTREMRTTVDDEQVSIKMNFAENQLLAEEQLSEHRDKPVVMEHEK